MGKLTSRQKRILEHMERRLWPCLVAYENDKKVGEEFLMRWCTANVLRVLNHMDDWLPEEKQDIDNPDFKIYKRVKNAHSRAFHRRKQISKDNYANILAKFGGIPRREQFEKKTKRKYE